MAKNLELNFKIRGSAEELKKIADSFSSIDSSAKKAAPSIDDVEKKLSKMAQGAGSAASRSGDLQGRIAGLGTQIQSGISSPLSSASEALGNFAGRLGVAGVAASATIGILVTAGTAAFNLVKEFGAAAEETSNLADRLDITAKQARSLEIASGIAGVNVNTLLGSTRLLAAALEDQTGQGEKTVATLNKLGVQLFDNTGKQRDLGKVMFEALNALEKIDSASQRAFLAASLLGKAGAKELTPLLKNLTELLATADRLGASFDENVNQQLAKADDEIGKLTVAWRALKETLAGKIAPIIIPIIQTLNGNPLGLSEADLRKQRGGVGSFADVLAQRQQERDSFRFSGDFGVRVRGFESTADEARRLSRQFGGRAEDTDEGVKARITKLRKESDELAAALRSGAIDDPVLFKSKEAKYDALIAEQKKLENLLRSRADSVNELKRLEDKFKSAQQDLARAETSAAGAALGGVAKNILEMKQRDEELLAALGPKFQGRVIALFNQQRGTEIGKLIAENRKRLADEAEKGSKDAASRLDEANKKFSEKLKETVAADLRAVEGLVNLSAGIGAGSAQRRAEGQVRAIEAGAGPVDGARVAEQSFRVRVALAKELFDIEVARIRLLEASATTQEEKDRLRLALLKAEADQFASIDEARLERESKIQEVRRESLNEARESAGRVFDALTQRGAGGLRQFLTGLGTQQVRAIFQNVTEGLFATVGQSLGRLGQASGIGGLFRGTLADPRNANAPVERAKTSVDRLRGSVDRLNDTIAGGAGGAGLGGVSGLPGGLGGLSDAPALLDRVVGKTGTGRSFIDSIKSFGAGAASILSAGLFSGFRSGDFSVQQGPGRATTASALGLTSTAARVGNIAGSAGALAGGAFGVVQGIREGGARGAFGAASSALGVAALIPGPQQPFVAAAAVITGLIKGLFGDPKAERAKEIDRLIANQKFKEPQPISLTIDSSGREIDRDFRGRIRVLNSTPRIERPDPDDARREIEAFRRPPAPQVFNVNMPVQTFDGRSFIDRAGDIANALTKALQDGHRVRGDINQVVRPI